MAVCNDIYECHCTCMCVYMKRVLEHKFSIVHVAKVCHDIYECHCTCICEESVGAYILMWLKFCQ